MPIPRKNATRLNHRDTQYIWVMQQRDGRTELQIEMSASVNGQVLVAELPRIVNPAMVTAAIDFGRLNGWTPDKAALPYHCKYLRGKYTRLESDA